MKSFILGACVFLGLSACISTTTTQPTVSRNVSSGFDIGDLPDPRKWGEDAVWAYFFPSNVPASHKERYRAKGYPGPWDQTIAARTRAACKLKGDPGIGASSRALEKYYRAALADFPRYTDCYIKTGPALAERRMAELAYLNELFDGVKDRPFPEWAVNPHFHDSEKQSVERKLTIDRELRDFEKTVNKLPEYADRLNKRIIVYGGFVRDNQRSWSNALNSALPDFARDNPLNKPGPGNSGLTLTTDLVTNASPDVAFALANLDRTMFGQEAYYRELDRRAAAAGAARRAQCISPGGASSGANLVLHRCPPYTKPKGNTCARDEQAIAARDRNEAERQKLDAYYADQQAATERVVRHNEIAAAAGAARRKALREAWLAKNPQCRPGAGAVSCQ